MRPEGCEADLLRTLASMPFLDRLEMVAVTGWSRGAVYEAVERLESGGFAASVPHATDLVPSTRRFHLTADGLGRLAGEEGVDLDELMHGRELPDQPLAIRTGGGLAPQPTTPPAFARSRPRPAA